MLFLDILGVTEDPRFGGLTSKLSVLCISSICLTSYGFSNNEVSRCKSEEKNSFPHK